MEKRPPRSGKVTHRAPEDRSETVRRKPYVAPLLVLHGDVRGMTLGGSPGGGDSGLGFGTENFLIIGP